MWRLVCLNYIIAEMMIVGDGTAPCLRQRWRERGKVPVSLHRHLGDCFLVTFLSGKPEPHSLIAHR